MPSRRAAQELPVEGSWRMVEGEHDSFDTSILPEFDIDEDLPVSSVPSHLSSQGPLSSMGSQESNHSISDFVERAEDERVILRSPFRPSIPSTRQASVDKNRTPDPEFYMPSIRIGNSPNQGQGQGSSGRSSRTIRPGIEDDHYNLRRRLQQRQREDMTHGSPVKRQPNGARGRQQQQASRDQYYDFPLEQEGGRTVRERLAESLPNAVLDVVIWLCDIIGMALRMLKTPLAICLAIYLCLGGVIIVQNMLTKSLHASLSPVCRIPGVGYLDLSFCPRLDDAPTAANGGTGRGQSVEFDELMDVQGRFEQVLERSAEGVSLPLEMKRSESSIRDLRTMVRHSEIPQREELVNEFNEYIEVARQTAADLQKFNTRVGSAVDAVISINRWTSRCLDAAAEKQNLLGPTGAAGGGGGESSALARWTSWIFFPFQPADFPDFNERALLDKYIEHAALVSDRIAGLIVEAQSVLRLLTKAEDHLSLIYDVVTRSQHDVKLKRNDVFWTIWTLIGANNKQLSGLNAQLDLLRNVDYQRSAAVAQLSALVLELESIQANLGDLRDKVAEPGLVREAVRPERLNMPLSVHIETINMGVSRLEQARQRIRKDENDRVSEALARGGTAGEDSRLLDSQRGG